MRKTIAQQLDDDGLYSEEDFIKAGGIKVGDGKPTMGRGKEAAWYRFPDGSFVWICDNCKGPFFDWGMGCCLGE